MENLEMLHLPPVIGIDKKNTLSDMLPGYYRELINWEPGVSGRLKVREGWDYKSLSVANKLHTLPFAKTEEIVKIIHQFDNKNQLRTFIILKRNQLNIWEYTTVGGFFMIANMGGYTPTDAVLIDNFLFVSVLQGSIDSLRPSVFKIYIHGALSGVPPQLPFYFMGMVKYPSKPINMAASAGLGNLSGTYRWRVVLGGTAPDGKKKYLSAPGQVSDNFTVTNKNVEMALPAFGAQSTSPKDHVDEVWIFRIGGTINHWRRINTTPLTAADLEDGINFTDFYADSILLNDPGHPALDSFENDQLVGNQTVDTNLNILAYHNDALWSCCSPDDNKVYRTRPQVGLEWSIEYFDLKNTMGFVSSDPVTAMVSTPRGLVVFMKNSMKLITGYSPPHRIEVLSNDIGCVDRRTISKDENDAVTWLSLKGWRQWDGGGQFKDISYFVFPFMAAQFKGSESNSRSVHYKDKTMLAMADGAHNAGQSKVFAFSDITQGVFEFQGLPCYDVFPGVGDGILGTEEVLMVFHTSDSGFGAPYPAGITAPDAEGYYFAKLKEGITDKRDTALSIETQIDTGNIVFPDNEKTLVKVPKFLDIGMKTLSGNFSGIENTMMKNIFFYFDGPGTNPFNPFANRCEYIKMLEADPNNVAVWRAYFARKLIFATTGTNPDKHLRGYNLRIRMLGGQSSQKDAELNSVTLFYKVMSPMYRKRSTAIIV